MNGARSSIRLRLLMFAALVTLTALAVAGTGLVLLFGRHIDRRIEQELDLYVTQIAGNLSVNAAGRIVLEDEPSNPSFAEPYAGRYWQVTDETDGTRLRSRSLWDFELTFPPPAAIGESTTSFVAGPEGQTLLLRDRRLVLVRRGTDHPVRISVAESEEAARQLQIGFARDLLPGLAILAAVLLAGACLQVRGGLRPFAKVRDGVENIRTGRLKRLDTNVPREIEPLVSEVNTLLEQQEKLITRSQDRAADLAHGLRTPLAALMADGERLRETGQKEIGTEIVELSGRMRRTVERELARARARHGRIGATASVAEIANAIGRALARTRGDDLRVIVEDEGIRIAMEADDLYDVLGNLMENAARVARGEVRVSVRSKDNLAEISVEDDGPPVDPQQIAGLIERGRRQDEAGGAGLGLAIVSDVLAEYSAEPEFFVSQLGGLGVQFHVRLR
jgi:signal transduction histidine kinase